MSTLSIILLLLVAAIVAAFAWLASLPKNFSVQRSISIKAAPSAVAQHIVNLKNWEKWDPWTAREPDCTLTYSANDGEVDSWYTWEGQLLGAGKMTNLAVSDSKIEQKLEFFKPRTATYTVEWELEGESDGSTKVVWRMLGNLPFFMRWLGPKMDAMLGPDYELGLALLRSVADPNAPQIKLTFADKTTFPGHRCLLHSVSGDLATIQAAMEEHFVKMRELAGKNAADHPFTLYHKMAMTDFQIDLAVPVSADFDASQAGDYRVASLAGGDFARATFQGPYSELRHAWHYAISLAQMKKIKAKKSGQLEVYRVSHGDAESDNDYETDLLIPLQ